MPTLSTTGRPTYLIGPLTPRAASGPGALDGFGFDCTCGGGLAASLPVLARQWREGHIAWHANRGDGVIAQEVPPV